MTKTLTEQWRNGKLEKGEYWCVSSWTDEIRMFYFEGDYFIDCDVPLDDDNIEEVLEPVPSYDEWKKLDDELKELATKNDTLAMENGRLEKRLAIATKALKKYMTFCRHPAEEALKEMKGVK